MLLEEAVETICSPLKSRAMGVAAITPDAGVHEGFAGAAAAPLFLVEDAGDKAAFWTSPAVIRPSGPVPTTVDMSIPMSAAIVLANGEATTRPPADAADAVTEAIGAALAAVGAEAAAGAATATGAPPPPLRTAA